MPTTMAVSILYCITAVLAPSLLAIRWIGSQIGVHPTKRSKYQMTMVDSRTDDFRGAGPESAPPPGRPCQSHPLNAYAYLPYCDATLSRDERVRYLIGRLTTEEKISLLGHDSPSVTRPGILHLPAYKWWNEGLHGFAWTDCCPPHQWENVTVFPQVIGLGMAWNRTLWGAVGDAVGAEAVRGHGNGESNGESNDPRPGLTYFTPNVNVFRDPRWGRGQETPGEDPYLTSHYAAIIVMSLQHGNQFLNGLLRQRTGPLETLGADARGEGGRPPRPRIAATCKHFAAYSLETNRLNFSADIHDRRDWNDTYLPAFDACIHAEQFLRRHAGRESRDDDARGGALGVMCSYNSVDQIPSCANPALLKKRLRRDWGFRGYVVSDCWAIANLHDRHHYAKSYQEAVGMALRAGVDLDCGDTIQGYGMKALEEGHVDIEDVDHALGNLFGVLMDVGYFEDDGPPTAGAAHADGGDESRARRHNQVALEAALQSIVLLKNGPDESTQRAPTSQSLPLSTTKHRRITLIGPLADDKEIPLGNYHGIPSHVITPMQGLRDLGVEVDYIAGCNVIGDPDEDSNNFSNDALCRQMSAGSDATILIMGLNQNIESEEMDRITLLLPKVQRDAIDEASRCAKSKNPNAPVILVAMTGGPLDLSSYKMDDDIDAILYTSYPGQEGGTAVARVLYGMYNPSGRLVTTMYPNSYLDRVALGDMRMRPEESNPAEERGEDTYPGRTYRFYDGPAVYPFGHGLSYSSWDYSIELITTNGTNSIEEERGLVFGISVHVSNTGPVDGSHSVLLFHKDPNAGSGGIPLKSLVGFEKVFVRAGGVQCVKLNVEKWMAAQKSGIHTLIVGPGMGYTLQINISEGGMAI